MNFAKKHNKKIIDKIRLMKPIENCEIILGYGFIIRFFSEKTFDIKGANDHYVDLISRHKSDNEAIIKTFHKTIFTHKKNLPMILHFQKKGYRIMMGEIMKHLAHHNYGKHRKEIMKNVYGFR